MSARGPRFQEAGFALIEALGALAIAGVVLSALLAVTSQWLPAWKRGLDRVQRAEMVAAALRRAGDDFAAAQFVSPNREQKGPLFVGQEFSAMFVRSELGPNAGHGLDVVRIGEQGTRNERAVLRSRAAFAPVPVGQSVADQFRFSDPAVLLSAPFRMSFAYADRSMVWTTEWRDATKLPFAVRMTIYDESRGREPVLVSAVRIEVDSPGGASVDGIAAGNASRPSAPAQPSQPFQSQPID
ncbi:putative General secretion pathway protein J, GspJ [Bradyrhizobium sp. ORS 285]|uniref:type II secretion system protein n=1 Tax=Bradyrhizobium sp. ORS 285 TaxID=115808 RepID=UPI00024073CF|nr:type II secretion system protein [Bradyrhizobium sp. ORS 285]CCD89628.1 putative General secretion pathway protein J, GspJ [Bradyrhizobium sp. ORS 285]SMX56307.1 putative General secretion pathway protein J, GspJ [Bradyrhizobium sp. ORS 285]